MLDFYINYKFLFYPKTFTTQIKLNYLKLITSQHLIIHKNYLNKLFKLNFTHLQLFFLYNKFFLKIAIKKKRLKFKKIYFINFQQYVY